MFPNSNFAIIIFDNEKIEEVRAYASEQEGVIATDSLAVDQKYVFIGWLDMEDTSKLIWILRDNIASNDDENMKLLMDIYNKVFSFEDDWVDENI